MLHSPTTDRTTDSATRQPHRDYDPDRQPATELGRFPGLRPSPTSPSGRPPSHPLADLHRTYGNQAILRSLRRPAITPVPGNPVQRRCNQCQHQLDEDRNPPSALGLQAKLTIGQPNDKYEQEADQVADRVMRMAESGHSTKTPRVTIQPLRTQRLCEECEEELQRQPLEEEKKEEEEDKKPVQAKGQAGQVPVVTPSLEARLATSGGGGVPLPEETRSFMESRFGQDFSGVRVHTDSAAVQMNRQLNAKAFTHGSDIYFGAGKAPGNNDLTAHELTHVVQQTTGAYGTPTSLEEQALSVERGLLFEYQVTQGIGTPRSLIQRSPLQILRIRITGNRLTAILDEGAPLSETVLNTASPGNYTVVYQNGQFRIDPLPSEQGCEVYPIV